MISQVSNGDENNSKKLVLKIVQPENNINILAQVSNGDENNNKKMVLKT